MLNPLFLYQQRMKNVVKILLLSSLSLFESYLLLFFVNTVEEDPTLSVDIPIIYLWIGLIAIAIQFKLSLNPGLTGFDR